MATSNLIVSEDRRSANLCYANFASRLSPPEATWKVTLEPEELGEASPD